MEEIQINQKAEPDLTGFLSFLTQVYLALINESNLRNGSSVGQSASSSGMSINYPGMRKGKRNRPTPVAVKVLHPNIREQFQRDLGVLRTLTAVLSTVFPRYDITKPI